MSTVPSASEPAAQLAWRDLTPTERNHLIGVLIGAPQLTQLYLAVDGKFWSYTPEHEEAKLDDLRAKVALWQENDMEWNDWQERSMLLDAWRGKITVEVMRWHLRYFETPGGGWVVVEDLRKRGYLITIQNLPDCWRVTCHNAAQVSDWCVTTGETMAEAACLAAIELIK